MIIKDAFVICIRYCNLKRFIKVMVLSYSMRHMPSSYSISYYVYTFTHTIISNNIFRISTFYIMLCLCVCIEKYYDIYCERGPQYNHRIILNTHSRSETHQLIQYFLLRHSITCKFYHNTFQYMSGSLIQQYLNYMNSLWEINKNNIV